LNVGGKPNVSTLAFIPITFEVTVLCAGLATAAAFLLKSRLYPRPRPAVAERITDDRFALVLDPLAGSLGESELRRLFAEAGADSVVASGGGEPGRAGLKPRARRQSPARGLGARFSGLRLLARGFSPVRKRGQRRASDLSLLLLALLASGCFWSSEKPAWEYLPDMRNSVPYDAFASNPVFRDGKTLQRPAPGTVPRGFLPFPYGPEPEEAERAGRELENPFPASPEVLVRGEHLYRTFCLVCHGETGTGDGPLIPKIAPPPAYDSESVRSHPPGRLFHVVTWGTGRMPSYRAQISQDDRWRLVHWVRKLQTSPPQTEEIAP
jgi:mono/diheme cytochrome c family protein